MVATLARVDVPPVSPSDGTAVVGAVAVAVAVAVVVVDSGVEEAVVELKGSSVVVEVIGTALVGVGGCVGPDVGIGGCDCWGCRCGILVNVTFLLIGGEGSFEGIDVVVVCRSGAVDAFVADCG